MLVEILAKRAPILLTIALQNPNHVQRISRSRQRITSICSNTFTAPLTSPSLRSPVSSLIACSRPFKATRRRGFGIRAHARHDYKDLRVCIPRERRSGCVRHLGNTRTGEGKKHRPAGLSDLLRSYRHSSRSHEMFPCFLRVLHRPYGQANRRTRFFFETTLPSVSHRLSHVSLSQRAARSRSHRLPLIRIRQSGLQRRANVAFQRQNRFPPHVASVYLGFVSSRSPRRFRPVRKHSDLQPVGRDAERHRSAIWGGIASRSR